MPRGRQHLSEAVPPSSLEQNESSSCWDSGKGLPLAGLSGFRQTPSWLAKTVTDCKSVCPMHSEARQTKRSGLEQRKMYCKEMGGSCPQTPNSRKGFSKAFLEAMWGKWGVTEYVIGSCTILWLVRQLRKCSSDKVIWVPQGGTKAEDVREGPVIVSCSIILVKAPKIGCSSVFPRGQQTKRQEAAQLPIIQVKPAGLGTWAPEQPRSPCGPQTCWGPTRHSWLRFLFAWKQKHLMLLGFCQTPQVVCVLFFLFSPLCVTRKKGVHRPLGTAGGRWSLAFNHMATAQSWLRAAESLWPHWSLTSEGRRLFFSKR